MNQVCDREPGRGLVPPLIAAPCGLRHRAKRDDDFDLTGSEERIEPAISVLLDRWLFDVRCTFARRHAVEQCVDQDVTVDNAELREKALHASACLAGQDAAQHVLVLAWILADHQHAGAAIQTPTVKDRAPLHAKILEGISGVIGVSLDYLTKRSRDVSWTKRSHAPGCSLRRRPLGPSSTCYEPGPGQSLVTQCT